MIIARAKFLYQQQDFINRICEEVYNRMKYSDLFVKISLKVLKSQTKGEQLELESLKARLFKY